MKKSRLFLVLLFLVGFIFPVGEAGAVFLLIAPGLLHKVQEKQM